MEGKEKLLIVICDINPLHWSKENENGFQKYIDSMMVFCNSYLMFNHSNKLAFFACNSSTALFIYPTADGQSNHTETLNATVDGKFELFVELNDSVTKYLKELINNVKDTVMEQSTLLPGAFAQALCYIHKKSHVEQGSKLSSRIFILQTSPDTSSQYMPIMNCIFASQKHNIVVDSCSINVKSGFLQQAADITNGIYNHVEDMSGFLELLLWLYLPDVGIRSKLQLPKSVEIDYRAACFCHKKLVDVGFVCSVCLSIYCQFMPKCLTCQTRFKLPHLPTIKPKKKKK